MKKKGKLVPGSSLAGVLAVVIAMRCAAATIRRVNPLLSPLPYINGGFLLY